MSMAAPAEIGVPEVGAAEGDSDQRVVLFGVDWQTYCAVRACDDRPGGRSLLRVESAGNDKERKEEYRGKV